jgi:uncharacterized protein (DUF2141 family)
MRLLAALMLSMLPMSAAAQRPAATLEVSIHAVRNSRGVVHACLTRDSAAFPDCSRDPAALKQTVAASTRTLRFAGVAPGHYALTLFHDENGNQRLDTLLGIPREGFGFSRNPVVRFGAPKFRQVGVEIAPGLARQSVRMQYLL